MGVGGGDSGKQTTSFALSGGLSEQHLDTASLSLIVLAISKRCFADRIEIFAFILQQLCQKVPTQLN